MTMREYNFYKEIKENAKKIYQQFKGDKDTLHKLLDQLAKEVYLSSLEWKEKDELIKAIDYWR